MSFLKTWIRNSTTKIFIWKGFILMVTSQDFIQTQKLQLQTVYTTLNRIVWRYFRRGFIDWYSHTTAWFRRIIIARFHNWPLRRKYLLCFSFSFHFRIGSYLKLNCQQSSLPHWTKLAFVVPYFLACLFRIVTTSLFLEMLHFWFKNKHF